MEGIALLAALPSMLWAPGVPNTTRISMSMQITLRFELIHNVKMQMRYALRQYEMHGCIRFKKCSYNMYKLLKSIVIDKNIIR
jgi:hypothetical protein